MVNRNVMKLKVNSLHGAMEISLKMAGHFRLSIACPSFQMPGEEESAASWSLGTFVWIDSGGDSANVQPHGTDGRRSHEARTLIRNTGLDEKHGSGGPREG